MLPTHNMDIDSTATEGFLPFVPGCETHTASRCCFRWRASPGSDPSGSPRCRRQVASWIEEETQTHLVQSYMYCTCNFAQDEEHKQQFRQNMITRHRTDKRQRNARHEWNGWSIHAHSHAQRQSKQSPRSIERDTHTGCMDRQFVPRSASEEIQRSGERSLELGLEPV